MNLPTVPGGGPPYAGLPAVNAFFRLATTLHFFNNMGRVYMYVRCMKISWLKSVCKFLASN